MTSKFRKYKTSGLLYSITTLYMQCVLTKVRVYHSRKTAKHEAFKSAIAYPDWTYATAASEH